MKKLRVGLIANLILLTSLLAKAEAAPETSGAGPANCGEMEVWDYTTAMCAAFPMPGMPMTMLMVHGNAFAVQTVEEGPRGRNEFAAPNMLMVDYGTTFHEKHYLNVDVMTTVERWSFPSRGYPELLQIGEANQNHEPFLDAQHPHSSPVMGLTFSDTIALGEEKDHLKIFFAPRGSSTEGPVAFMHRPTGLQNPDAPLGHHVGQDVGHIASTVVGASLRNGKMNYELSAFNGTEPEPSNVDLPLGSLNSGAVRVIRQFTAHLYAMASAAYVKSPEPQDPDLKSIQRYSASVYNDQQLNGGGTLYNALIWGLVNGYDHAAALNSFAEEFWFHEAADNFWSRFEVLQRTAGQLQFVVADPSANPNTARWVTAATLGYTRNLGTWSALHVSVGASLTKDFLPSELRTAYGGDPLSAKVFLQLSGMRMWD
jgi:hypothetical protein